MEKKVQKMVAVIIGLVLAGLLIYIGIRIVQKRGSQASEPENFSCTRGSDAEATCTYINGSSEIGRIMYATMPAGGTEECNLVFIEEEVDQPVAQGSGKFLHTVTMSPLVANTSYCAAVGGFEDGIIEIAGVSSGGAGGSSNNNQDGVSLNATPTPSEDAIVQEPTEVIETIAPTEAPVPTDEPASEADIDEYYSENTGDTWVDCLNYFDGRDMEISGNACIVGYYRNNPSVTP